MKKIPVSSDGNIIIVGYDPDNNNILEIESHNGKIKRFGRVPKYVFNELINSTSIHKFVDEHIKGKYSPVFK